MLWAKRIRISCSNSDITIETHVVTIRLCIRVLLGETSALRGAPQLHKNWVPEWPKTPHFRCRRRRKFWKIMVFKGRMALFEVLWENLPKFWFKWWFRTNLNTKMKVFRFWKEFRNFVWKFWEIFQKIQDLKLHIFEKLLLKNAIKHQLLGYLKLHKFRGSPVMYHCKFWLRKWLQKCIICKKSWWGKWNFPSTYD